MWNEIWNFIKDNIGTFAIGIFILYFILKKFVYDKWKRKRYEAEVPSPEQEEISIRDQPEYTPLFKDKTDELSNIDTQIKKAKLELQKITIAVKRLELEEDQLEKWHMAQGKKVVERQNSITARGQKINDKHSFYVNQLKGLENLKKQQEMFLGERGE